MSRKRFDAFRWCLPEVVDPAQDAVAASSGGTHNLSRYSKIHSAALNWLDDSGSTRVRPAIRSRPR